MTSAKTNPASSRRRLLPGADWLMVAAGVLALAGSLLLFIESGTPRLAQTNTELASAS
jgi:hypothetical protein